MPESWSPLTSMASPAPFSVETAFTSLIFVVVPLTVALQLAVDALCSSSCRLIQFDEHRINERILGVEAHIRQAFSDHDIDASQEDALTMRERQAITSQAPHAVASDTLLATKVMFPVMHGAWCEVAMAASAPAGQYEIRITGVVGHLGLFACGSSPLLQGSCTHAPLHPACAPCLRHKRKRRTM